MRYEDVAALYAAVGEGHVSTQSVHREGHRARCRARPRPTRPKSRSSRRAARASCARATPGVLVRGAPDILVKLAKCCTPVPGDEIVGFVTRGSGVSVHRADCTNVEGAADRPRADDRGRVGADDEERVPRADPGRGARPLRAAVRRDARAQRAPREHPVGDASRPRATGWRSAGSSSRWATSCTSTACSTRCAASTPCYDVYRVSAG